MLRPRGLSSSVASGMHLRCVAALGLILAWAACGGGSGFDTVVDDPEGGVSLSVGVLWQQPGARVARGARAAFSSDLPDAVRTVRVEVDTDLGGKCCLAVDPRDPDVAGSSLVIDALPVGDLRLRISGYAADLAPADGVTRTCSARPASLALPCDEQAHETPSFDSAPSTFTVLDGMQTRSQIEVGARPFLTGRSPDSGEELRTPGQFMFAVVDAANLIDSDLAAFVTFPGDAPEELGYDSFLICEDAHATKEDCSQGGVLGVSGFRLESSPVGGEAGQVQVQVLAGNEDEPPQQLDFTYVVNGLPLQVDLTFRLSDAVGLASIGFDVDYSLVEGDFEGSGATVACEGLVEGAFDVFNDDDTAARTLLVRTAVLDGIQGPRDLVRCRFGGFNSLPEVADFSVSVTEATDADAVPLEPLPAVAIAAIEAVR